MKAAAWIWFVLVFISYAVESGAIIIDEIMNHKHTPMMNYEYNILLMLMAIFLLLASKGEKP